MFNEIIGEVIEGSVANFVQFDPATSEAVLFDSNSSVSFAQSRSIVKTFDDELYVINISETGARGRRFDVDALLSPPPDAPIPVPRQFDSVSDRCVVVIGNDLFYKVAFREASFPGTGFEDGPLVRVAGFFDGIGGRTLTELIPGIGGDSATPGGFVTDACQFNMDFADGQWFDADQAIENGQQRLLIRDQTTGEIASFVTVTGLDAITTQYDVSNWAFDAGFAYFVAVDAVAQAIEIVRVSMTTGVAETVHREELVGAQAEFVFNLDVDDGHVAFVIRDMAGDETVGLFSPGDATIQTFDFGASVTQLQVMFREN